MNLLVVYPYIPYPLDRGTYQRTFHLLRGLAARHTVDLIALSENGERLEHAPVFEEFCREVRFVPFSHPEWDKLFPKRLLNPVPSTIRHWRCEELARVIREQIAKHHYDAVHVCDIVLAQYFLREHRDIPLVVDRSRVDLQFQSQQCRFAGGSLKEKFLAWENMAKLWFYERRVARRCRRQILCGPDDEVFVRTHISRNVPLKVIPNGVDPAFFHHDPAATTDEAPTIVFCGAMDYTPNVDALRWYFSGIHHRVAAAVPKLRVLIVGRGAGAEIQAYGKIEGVTVTGGVPDVRPYYRRSWLQIVPLRIGGGTRLKILESLSIGVPVVSTTIGAQGLGLVHGSDALLADSAEEFAARIVDGLSSDLLRERLRQRGIAKAHAEFTWDSIGRRLSDTYGSAAPRDREQVRLLGVPFDRVTMKGALARIAEMVEERRPRQIATANVDFLVQAGKDPELREILEDSDLVLCDGTPLVWLSRWIRQALPERVAGSDLAAPLLALAERRDWSLYFLGGKDEVLADAVKNVRRKHPRLRIAGAYSPEFAPLEEMDHDAITARVREAAPDLLFVCFGCPKQEKWLARHLAATGAPVGIGLGATIDFLAGHVRRSPRWMRFAGMEWIFRLLQEPRRLFHRYATDLRVFSGAALQELRQQRGTQRF